MMLFRGGLLSLLIEFWLNVKRTNEDLEWCLYTEGEVGDFKALFIGRCCCCCYSKNKRFVK